MTMTELAVRDTGILERLGVAVSRTSLSLPVQTSYEDFEHVCAFVGAMNDATNWWIADAFIQGEKLFGDDVFQAAELLHKSPSTIQNIVSIGRRVPPEIRRENVRFTHHGEVSSLPSERQEHWLKETEENGWTKTELRSHVQAERLEERGSALPPAVMSIEDAARAVWHASVRAVGDTYFIPAGPMLELKKALGE